MCMMGGRVPSVTAHAAGGFGMPFLLKRGGQDEKGRLPFTVFVSGVREFNTGHSPKTAN
jgi:hypothetical protein